MQKQIWNDFSQTKSYRAIMAELTRTFSTF